MTQGPLPSYEHPPLVEVVCGVLFRPVPIQLQHVGLLWQQYREYPEVVEVTPLAPIVETFDSARPAHTVELTDVPPLPRVWFRHGDGSRIIQLQRDRFLHNWKVTTAEQRYPRYAAIKKMFGARLVTFYEFIEKEELGEPQPRQYELTYVNHLPQGSGWSTIRDIPSLFLDHCTHQREGRFLPEVDSYQWRTSYPLPEKHGRLHITIRSATRVEDDKPICVVELTARGFPSTDSREAMWDWFDLAHEWIVRGFADVTSDEIQEKQWGRIQ